MTATPKSRCPICSKPSLEAYHPFCSKRCADVDLSRWLGGVYRVETEEPTTDGADGPVSRDEN